MAIDYGLTNTTRYYSVPDDADFALPDTDWAWMVQCRIEPDATNPRYIIATNGYGNATSFNLVVNSSPFRLLGKYNATADLLTASSPPESVPVWLYATRRSGVFYAGFCPVGSSTVVEATGTNIAGTTSDGTVLRLGGNSTGTTTRMWMGGWTQYALSSGQGVTAAQIAELAMGAPLLAMPFAPSLVFALHGKTASATIADSIKGKIATRAGTSYGTLEEDAQTPYVWMPTYARGIAGAPPGGTVIPVFVNHYHNQGIM